MALRFKQQLASLQDAYPRVIEEVRGSGLLTGLKLKPPLGEVVDACMAEKLLTVGAGDNVVRLLPPLILSAAEADQIVGRLAAVIRAFLSPAARAA